MTDKLMGINMVQLCPLFHEKRMGVCRKERDVCRYFDLAQAQCMYPTIQIPEVA